MLPLFYSPISLFQPLLCGKTDPATLNNECSNKIRVAQDIWHGQLTVLSQHGRPISSANLSQFEFIFKSHGYWLLYGSSFIFIQTVDPEGSSWTAALKSSTIFLTALILRDVPATMSKSGLRLRSVFITC